MNKKNNNFVCPICGAPTMVYMGNVRKDKLCRKHADEYKQNLIMQCEKCGKWHNTNEPCSCNNPIKYLDLPTEGFEICVLCGEKTNGYAFCRECWKKYSDEELLDLLNGKSILSEKKIEKQDEQIKTDNVQSKENENLTSVAEQIIKNNVVIFNENNKSKCVTCGIKTEGLLFCPSCYRKYKNKSLLFKITNCTNIELLDESYEGRLTCKDGHIVKSKSERDIDNYLFDNGILHAYEKEVSYGPTAKETIHPDFYLPNYLGRGEDVYIEHWGYGEDHIEYTKTKKFKMPIYKKKCSDQEMTLVCTYEKSDIGKINDVLERKLKKSNIKKNAINYEE